MPDFSMHKLGKAAPRHDKRTLCLATYTAGLEPAPDACAVTPKLTNIGMMCNDKLGDCTCAAIGHIVQLWTACNGTEVILSDDQITSLYENFGYVPGDETTDQGAVELDVLNYWHKNGVYGHALPAFVSIAPAKPQQVRDAVYYFGAAYVGVALPNTAQKQDVWDVVATGGPDAEPNSWGGHAIPIVAYDQDTLTCITWGAPLKMTWAFFAKYCDEAYAPLGNDWIGPNGKCPVGFDLASLQTDLQGIVSA